MSVGDSFRDALDIVRRARGPKELLAAALPGLAGRVVLNEGESSEVGTAAELIHGLRSARNQLKGSLVEGKVDYQALREGAAFARLAELAPCLVHVSAADLPSDAERLAFFINLYNVLAIHGVLALELNDSVMEMPSFFARVSYRVGAHVLSLDEIENGVLRLNGAHPATGRRLFSKDDPALRFCPSRLDPRIHAALVCASTSCPPVGFYDADALDDQLERATASYVCADVSVEDDAVRVPITFRYYASDWGERADLESFLVRYADAPLAEQLRGAFAKGLPFEYQRYDWSLNHVV